MVVGDSPEFAVGRIAVMTASFILLMEFARSVDVLARWGGEEFAMMLPGCDGAMAFQAAEKLRAVIAEVAIDAVGVVTCSFGVAQYVDGETAASLIARADRALYRAKINGCNCVELATPDSESATALASVA